jgi:hypothetical protein
MANDLFDVAAPSTPTTSTPGNDLFSPDEQKSAPGPSQGELINDVGNKVVVPKPGESFADTMQRAAAYGKTVTPGQINAELKTAPGKAATVLGAAPVIGAAGAAGITGLAESPTVLNKMRSLILEEIKANPIKTLSELGVAGGVLKYLFQATKTK